MNSRTEEALSPLQGSAAQFSGKYLTFRLGSEEYGIEIMKVQEIIGLLPINELPMVPHYVRGFINLRRRVIATIDLRVKFGFEPVPDTERTCIIVVEVGDRGHEKNVGLVVEEVAEVLTIHENQVEATPTFGGSLDTRFIRAIGLVDAKVKILLDIDQVLTTEELGKLPSSKLESPSN